MKWLEYFKDTQKQQVILGAHDISIDYGDIIYKTSDFMDSRWLVAKYMQEYNVFVEQHVNQKSDRKLAATFSTKDRAIAFAAEMFLICCGRLKRKNRRCLSKINPTENP